MSNGREQWALGHIKSPWDRRNRDSNMNYKVLHTSRISYLNGILLGSKDYDFADGDYFKYHLSGHDGNVFLIKKDDWTKINNHEASELRRWGEIKKAFYNPNKGEFVVLGRWNDRKRFPYFLGLGDLKQGLLTFPPFLLMYAQMQTDDGKKIYERFKGPNLVIGDFGWLLSDLDNPDALSLAFSQMVTGNRNKGYLIDLLEEEDE